ncbi:signal recognition particle-docking protein FtsY [Irregularibacter muris]|uniref:Signal recognition particle receptor FtsY n=1 Tax=Irregularibacter muris TaxID=1796619 RepID=A0AAE3HD31_9FIRM|nr:signal recognition particle-docking protein FtsY [Irregularibacter muris]MCR1898137.1 signal recognition particle-docking protein FtsY [Irregularibacter muris]
MKEKETPSNFFTRLKEGLSKTKQGITEKVDQIISQYQGIDEELYEEIEEVLITADIGMETTIQIIDNLKTRVRKNKISDPQELRSLLKEVLYEILKEDEEFPIEDPCVILIIGVNGVGKTTSIGKLAAQYKSQGKSVLLAAGDTFRAAAVEQLDIWANRVGVDIIKHKQGSDPAAVIYDAIQAAKARNTDILICDTAGRLHNKKNLMNELEKINRIISKEFPESNRHTFLVLDATTGQNAISQAKLFSEICDVNGLILTKLDGTSKGGVILAIKSQLNIPVRFVGVGEGVKDLQIFNAEQFVDALF